MRSSIRIHCCNDPYNQYSRWWKQPTSVQYLRRTKPTFVAVIILIFIVDHDNFFTNGHQRWLLLLLLLLPVNDGRWLVHILTVFIYLHDDQAAIGHGWVRFSHHRGCFLPSDMFRVVVDGVRCWCWWWWWRKHALEVTRPPLWHHPGKWVPSWGGNGARTF